MADDGIYYVEDKPTGDESLDITFSKRTTLEGEEIDFIRIAIPGNLQTVVEEPVNEQHKQRFAKHWQAYSTLQNMTGTPIEEWPDVNDAIIREFKRYDFNYIEQLANAPDASLMNIMGGPTWRQKARSYLHSITPTPEKLIEAQQAHINEQAAEMAEMKRQIAELMGRKTIAKA